jgi:hypothetical protein
MAIALCMVWRNSLEHDLPLFTSTPSRNSTRPVHLFVSMAKAPVGPTTM